MSMPSPKLNTQSSMSGLKKIYRPTAINAPTVQQYSPVKSSSQNRIVPVVL